MTVSGGSVKVLVSLDGGPVLYDGSLLAVDE